MTLVVCLDYSDCFVLGLILLMYLLRYDILCDVMTFFDVMTYLLTIMMYFLTSHIPFDIVE